LLCVVESSPDETHAMKRHRHLQAFTLVELLVAMALTLLIVTAATTALFQMLSMTRRLQAKLVMDAAAKTVFERLHRETSAMQPRAAVWLRSTSGPKTVECVFMCGKEMPTDFPRTTGNVRIPFTDLVWTRWYWSADSERLDVSSSSSARWSSVSEGKATNNTYWKYRPSDPDPNTNGPRFTTLLCIPLLRSESGITGFANDPAAVLDQNSWNYGLLPATSTTGSTDDYGDYEDLKRNARPLLHHCTNLTIELQNLDGSKHTADGSVVLNWGASGGRVDGADKPDLGSRPSLVRLKFTLTDIKTKAVSTYSMSCATSEYTRY